MIEYEKHQIAVVTGGTEGIGRAITEQLLQQNLTVATCARDAAKLQSLKETYPSLDVRTVDLSDRQNARLFMETAIQQMNGLDLLVLNASDHGVPHINETPDQEKQRKNYVFRLNEVAQVALTRSAAAALRESQGTIVFLTSGLARATTPLPGSEDYAKSKRRIEEYLQEFIHRPENNGIFVFSVNPGPVNTNMHDFIIEHGPEQLAQMSKMAKDKGMLADPKIVGKIIAKMSITKKTFNPATSEYDIPIENGSVVTIAKESFEFETSYQQ